MVNLHFMTNKKDLILIAGPCSAESEKQLLTTAEGLASGGGVNYFRAGIWKPRSQPGYFEGVGDEGLEWMIKLREIYGFSLITEVGNSAHADKVLKLGFDAIWIGARTSVNPFYVQEIADVLKGTDVPVFVKNPINPDLKLWLGAIERFEKVSNAEVLPIHRGFSLSGNSRFRNVPNWQIPIELHTLRPDLRLICDPSHIAGKRDYIFEVAQKAMDLNYSGLMIETHPNPDTAKSDAKQQITPEQFWDGINNLFFRKNYTPDTQTLSQLKNHRESIDVFDQQLLEVLAKRMEVSEEIGKLKNKNGISVLQPERWKSILDAAHINGEAMGLSYAFIDQLFKAVHDESIDRQTKKVKK
ncbi:MAG: 3-deoxy-7-phosphoheptulonate synthase [Saprospirales bacterium]|nr:MAG: 3-deoxy-7-phosphoheptulonate synthase [Saprospirales bacterium]